MNIRKSTVEDIETLIRIRIDYLVADTGYLTEEEKVVIISQLTEYYNKHINCDFIAILAEIDGKVVSAAFLVLVEKPANPAFMTGKTGTLLNVFTYPEYRRRGIAKVVVERLLDEAKQLGASCIDLSATVQGKPLYEKLGFTAGNSKYTPMKLQLI